MARIRAPVFVLMQLDYRQEIFQRIDQGIEDRIVRWCFTRCDEFAVGRLLGRRDDTHPIAPCEQNHSEADETRDPPQRAQRHVAESDRTLKYQAPYALKEALMAEAALCDFLCDAHLGRTIIAPHLAQHLCQ